MDEFIDPVLGRLVTSQEIRGCDGCVYDGEDDVCGRPRLAPTCTPGSRSDRREVIWIRAADAPQAPKAVRLTDEQIAQITAQTWGSVDIAPQSAAAFARAIEAAALKANNLEMPE